MVALRWRAFPMVLGQWRPEKNGNGSAASIYVTHGTAVPDVAARRRVPSAEPRVPRRPTRFSGAIAASVITGGAVRTGGVSRKRALAPWAARSAVRRGRAHRRPPRWGFAFPGGPAPSGHRWGAWCPRGPIGILLAVRDMSKSQEISLMLQKIQLPSVWCGVAIHDRRPIRGDGVVRQPTERLRRIHDAAS